MSGLANDLGGAALPQTAPWVSAAAHGIGRRLVDAEEVARPEEPAHGIAG